MRLKTILGMVSCVSVLVGCATTGQNVSTTRALTNDEAMAFENTLKPKVVLDIEMPKHLYTQPVNKDEDCKILTTQEQLNRENFRAYWDGKCKGGYAYGLGRDIAVSDTHHVEEITVYAENGRNPNAPSVVYDFVNGEVRYSVRGSKYPAETFFSELIRDDFDGFIIGYFVGTVDESGRVLATMYSPLTTQKTLTSNDRNIIHEFVDDTAAPSVAASAVKYVALTKDTETSTAEGVGIVGYGNGQVRHFKVNGEGLEEVMLPPEYLKHLDGKYREILNAREVATRTIEAAREIERRYLFKVCNDNYSIDGLDDEISTKICSWRDQFEEPYKEALINYTARLEEMKLVASSAEQQRQIQAQLAMQQQLVQQQLSQQSFQRSMDALRRTTQNLQNSNAQILNGIMSQPAPQVTPLTLPGDNRVTCITVGRVTNCQ